jgi:hypothetical protein
LKDACFVDTLDASLARRVSNTSSQRTSDPLFGTSGVSTVAVSATPNSAQQEAIRMRRFLLTLPLVLVLVVGSAIHSSAAGPKLLNAHVVGSTPNFTIRSVVSGAAPWVVQEGKATVDPNGKVKVKVRGLLIASGVLANGDPVPAALVGTVGPVTSVHAALTCGGPGGGVPFTVTATDAVPLNPQGNFQINETLTLPATCDRPVMLIRIGEPDAGGAFIALAAPFFLREGED